MRQVFIKRTRSNDAGTFGELMLDDPDSEYICVTCELPWNDNEPQKSCIPVGTYIFNAYSSPTHGQVWMAKNVSGRSFIQIHAANWPDELLGCIAVGEDYSDNLGGKGPGVTHSQNTMKSLRSIFPNTIQVTITEDL